MNKGFVSEFKRLVDFIRVESKKKYAGKQNEAELNNSFNTAIMMGQEYSNMLRKDKVRLQGYSINFFKGFKQ